MFINTSVVPVLFLFLLLTQTTGYTFISSGDTTTAAQVPFSPGERGFTGYYGEPSDPQRYRVNPGNVLTFDKPM